MQTQDIRVAVIACARTPFAKANTALREYSALELGRHSVDGLLEKAAFDPAMTSKSQSSSFFPVRLHGENRPDDESP